MTLWPVECAGAARGQGDKAKGSRAVRRIAHLPLRRRCNLSTGSRAAQDAPSLPRAASIAVGDDFEIAAVARPSGARLRMSSSARQMLAEPTADVRVDVALLGRPTGPRRRVCEVTAALESNARPPVTKSVLGQLALAMGTQHQWLEPDSHVHWQRFRLVRQRWLRMLAHQ